MPDAEARSALEAGDRLARMIEWGPDDALGSHVDRILGRSRTTKPGAGLVWTLYVSDQLVEAADDWSPPVQFRFERLADGRLEMHVRRAG